jgi:hypothetical protein
MKELITEEEICKQLLELAETPEQVQYLTTSNQSVLIDKVNQLKAQMEVDYRNTSQMVRIHQAREEAYLKAIVELAKGKYSEYD